MERKDYKAYNIRNIDEIQEMKRLPPEMVEDMKIVSAIIPFRTNNYVIDELIDWNNIPDDPIFRLNFPQKEMLNPEHYKVLKEAIESGETDIKEVVNIIQHQVNPHPGGQMDHNVPLLNGELCRGIQHKYRETALVFPSEGQTCFAFCTYCFRWAQFIGQKDMKISMNDPDKLVEYLQQNETIQDLLITGGDPLVMKASKLSKYIRPLLEANIPHLRAIRIGSKSLAYWPYRFISDSDSEAILELFKDIIDSDIHLSFVANFNHPRELETEAVKLAIRNIQNTGAIIRTQTPLLRTINDNPDCLARMWRKQVDLGMVPYYLFIVRNTGAKRLFELPIVEAYKIFNTAYSKVSGLCRTVRGPIMSTTPGKVQVLGTAEINNTKTIILRFIQGRNPAWVGKPFFAKYDTNATWFDELEPAFGQKQFFYESETSKYFTAYSSQDNYDEYSSCCESESGDLEA